MLLAQAYAFGQRARRDGILPCHSLDASFVAFLNGCDCPIGQRHKIVAAWERGYRSVAAPAPLSPDACARIFLAVNRLKFAQKLAPMESANAA